MLKRYEKICAYIMLGDKCNADCKYCVRETHTDNKTLIDAHSMPISDKLYYNIERFAKRLKNKRLEVLFFGGEPLIYYDRIQEIVQHLGNNYNYVVFTNGKLLTDDKVEWFNENNFTVCVSWDGRNSLAIRGYDPIKAKWDTIKKIDKLHISAVLSSKIGFKDTLDDINDVFNRLSPIQQQKFGFRFIPIMAAGMDEGNEFLQFDYNKLYKDIYTIVSAHLNDTTDNNIYHRFAKWLIQTYYEKAETFRQSRSRCYSVDIAGNLYNSHVKPTPVNCEPNTDDEYMKLGQYHDEESLCSFYTKKFDLCKLCPGRSFCRARSIEDVKPETKVCSARIILLRACVDALADNGIIKKDFTFYINLDSQNEMKVTDFETIINQIKDFDKEYGYNSVIVLKGNSVLLYPTFANFVAILRDNNLKWNIETNNTEISINLATALKQLGCQSYTIWIDKPSELIDKNIELLKQANINAIIATKANNDTLALIDYIINNTKPTQFYFIHDNNCELSAQEYRKLLGATLTKIPKFEDNDIRFIFKEPLWWLLFSEMRCYPYTKGIPKYRWFNGREGGYNALQINSYGDVEGFGNALQIPLKDLWGKPLSIKGKCENCELVQICRGINDNDSQCWR